MEIYVHVGGENDERVFLCRPGIDDNLAECFETGFNGTEITAKEAGERIANSVNAITRIMALLNDTEEWDSETMGDLANILHEEGFKLREAEATRECNRDTLHDFVVAHGEGKPTDEGYSLGAQLMGDGDDYATAAAEIVARGLTVEEITKTTGGGG